MFPKGFKGNYFNLAAIQASTTALKTGAERTRIQHHFLVETYHVKEAEEISDDTLLEAASQSARISAKPLRCNCFFDHLTKLKLHFFIFIPRCPFYNTYFAFRRSGVHPPLLSF